MALELLDTKWAGVIQPDPARPSRLLVPGEWLPTGRRRAAGDDVGCVVTYRLGASPPSASRPQRCSGRGQQPQDLGLTFGELGKGRLSRCAAEVLKHARRALRDSLRAPWFCGRGRRGRDRSSTRGSDRRSMQRSGQSSVNAAKRSAWAPLQPSWPMPGKGGSVNLICGERQRWRVAAVFSILRSVTLIDVLERTVE